MDQRPDSLLVHANFDLMVGTGTLLLLLAIWVGWLWWRGKRLPEGRWLLRSVAIAGPFGFIALEAGWMVTELGRQPWVVYGMVRTADAVTPAPGILPIFIGFSLLYLGLAGTVIWLLRRVAAAKILPDAEAGNQPPTGPSGQPKEGDYAVI